MAVNVTLTDVASGYNRGAVNDNFTAIKTALQDALSRSGSTVNTMSADIDMNSNDLLNVASLSTDELTVAGVIVTDATYVPDWKGPWLTTTAYVINDLIQESGSSYICLIAHTSGTFSTDLTAVKWELFAQQGSSGAGTGDMLAANNLSDVTNVATSRSNLGLGDVAVQNKSTIDITGGTVVGITDLTVADGGTGSSTASAAFTALKQAASTTATGVVEKATTAEAEAGTSADKFPDVVGVKAAIVALASTPDYGAGNAALSIGAIGTYALLWNSNNTTATYAAGTTFAGSILRYSSVATSAEATPQGSAGSGSISNSNGTPSGTWRLMGYTKHIDLGGSLANDDNSLSLYLRIL